MLDGASPGDDGWKVANTPTLGNFPGKNTENVKKTLRVNYMYRLVLQAISCRFTKSNFIPQFISMFAIVTTA